LTHSLESYINCICTNIYFKDTKYTPNNIPALLSPPTNTISTSIDTYLDIYKTNITHQINTYNFTNHLTHIDQLIRNNLIKLSLNRNIVIKPADKNLGTCIVTIDIYMSMCYTILNDNKTYSKLVNCDTSYSYSFNNLHNILKKYNMHEYIKRDNTNTIVSYKSTLYKSLMQLQNSHLLKTANFYALPKMHKIS